MELTEKTLSSKLVYNGGLLKVYYDTVELVDGSTSWREVVRHPGAVVMVPVDGQGNVYLVVSLPRRQSGTGSTRGKAGIRRGTLPGRPTGAGGGDRRPSRQVDPYGADAAHPRFLR